MLSNQMISFEAKIVFLITVYFQSALRKVDLRRFRMGGVCFPRSDYFQCIIIRHGVKYSFKIMKAVISLPQNFQAKINFTVGKNYQRFFSGKEIHKVAKKQRCLSESRELEVGSWDS